MLTEVERAKIARRLRVLEQEHIRYERKIRYEQTKVRPDELSLQWLKRKKLRLRDEINAQRAKAALWATTSPEPA